MQNVTRELVCEWDETDPLRFIREEFHLPPDVIYLDGNSLGPMPKRALARVRQAMENEWGPQLIRGWNEANWYTMPAHLGDRIGRLIGAAPGQVIVSDSTSINLFKLVTAAVRMRPGRSRIVSEAANFPTDLYMLQSVCDLLPGHVLSLVPSGSSIEDHIQEDVAVVAFMEVDFRTGRRHNMARITKCAHDAGALTVWDLAHSAGAFPVELDACEADFAVGCTYKYLNAGPGAPAFLYVAERHQHLCAQPLSGWMGHDKPFAFSTDFQPAVGIQKFLCGTPPILSMASLDGALDVWDAVDMTDVVAKSALMTSLFIDQVDRFASSCQITIATPRETALRGSQISLRHQSSFAIMEELISRGLVGDFRAPDILRFGFTPLTLRYVDVFDAASMLEDVMKVGRWRNNSKQRDEAIP